MPKCHPEGVAELALAEKMATLEGKLKVFEDTLGEIKSNTVQNSQKMDSVLQPSRDGRR